MMLIPPTPHYTSAKNKLYNPCHPPHIALPGFTFTQPPQNICTTDHPRCHITKLTLSEFCKNMYIINMCDVGGFVLAFICFVVVVRKPHLPSRVYTVAVDKIIAQPLSASTPPVARIPAGDVGNLQATALSDDGAHSTWLHSLCDAEAINLCRCWKKGPLCRRRGQLAVVVARGSNNKSYKN